MNLIRIDIYRFSGKQLFFHVPEQWCEECDLLIALVKAVIAEENMDDQVELHIYPWWFWWWRPLFLHRAWHPPMLVINGKLVSQGVVPPKEEVRKALLT